VITPVTALAAATAGLERYTRFLAHATRKLRLVVLKDLALTEHAHVPPRQAPHVAVVQAAPRQGSSDQTLFLGLIATCDEGA
jgi:hypothetical protein